MPAFPSRPPSFTLTPEMLERVGDILRLIGRYEGIHSPKPLPKLRRQNRIRTIRGSLAIEGNSLTEDQITAILEGKRVVGPRHEIIEVRNAIEVYDRAPRFHPNHERDFLKAHGLMMQGLIDGAGRYRSGEVGILHGKRIAHLAPSSKLVPKLMQQLFAFLKSAKDVNLLIRSALFHYEVEFIHPFSDGNGRIGRFWQHVLLVHFHPLFEFVPVESLIKDRQKEYYAALRQSDQAGDGTIFVEFSLRSISRSLELFLRDIKPEPLKPAHRLDLARTEFRTREFSRKDYLRLLKTLSTATASRDLKEGVDQGRLKKTGDKASARYRFI